MSALASPCSAVLPLPKLPPSNPCLSSLTQDAGAEKLCLAKKVVFSGNSALDALKTGYDAGQRADMFAVARDGIARGNACGTRRWS